MNNTIGGSLPANGLSGVGSGILQLSDNALGTLPIMGKHDEVRQPICPKTRS